MKAELCALLSNSYVISYTAVGLQYIAPLYVRVS